MSLQTPLWMQDGSYSGTLDRELIDAVFSTGGVVVGTDLAVTQRAAGANMSVDVAAGKCVVVGTDTTGQGKYLCKSTAIVNVTIATAPSSGNSRIDLIVAQVRDADQNGGSNNDWIITVIAGTPATTGTQVAPSAPASALVLAHVLVGPTVTTISNGVITDFRTQASGTVSATPLGAVMTVFYGCTSSFATITGMAQPTLPVGKWDVCFIGAANCPVTGGDGWVDVQIVAGTGVGSFVGPTVTEAFASTNSAGQPLALRTVVEVTTAGTFLFQAKGTASTSIDPQTSGGGVTGATGWTATLIP